MNIIITMRACKPDQCLTLVSEPASHLSHPLLLLVSQLQTNNMRCTIEKAILPYKGIWMYIFRLQIFFTDVVSIICFARTEQTFALKSKSWGQDIKNDAFIDCSSWSSLYKQHKMTHNNTSIYGKKKCFKKIIHVTPTPSVLECLFVQTLRSSTTGKQRETAVRTVCVQVGVCASLKKIMQNGPKSCALHSHSTGERCPPISRLRAASRQNVEDFLKILNCDNEWMTLMWTGWWE